MDRRKQAILTHLAVYRFSIRTLIEEHIISGDASRELNELKVEGLINIYPRLLGGGRSVYQLTPAGAREVSRPASIAAAPKPQGLIANLSLLWFCFNGETKRFRLEPADQAELLANADEKPQVVSYHVLEPRQGGSFIYRVYVPTPRAKKTEVERTLYGIASAARKSTKANAFVSAGRYGVAVLVQNADRAKAIRGFLHRTERKTRSVTKMLSVQVVLVPDFLLPAASSVPRRVFDAKLEKPILTPEAGEENTETAD
jgi:hypothetical protein